MPLHASIPSHCYIPLQLFATLFWLPIGEVPVISAMGRRTLFAYLLRSQVPLAPAPGYMLDAC